MIKFFQNNRNIITIVSFLILANVLFFHQFTLRSFEIISFGFLLYLFSSTQRGLDFSWKSFDVWSIITLIISLWITMIFRSYIFIRMVSVGGVVISIFHLIYLLSLDETEYKSFIELSLSPLRAIKHYFKAFQSPAKTTKKLPQISLDKLWPILAGIIIGIPVVVVLLRLFSSDPVFGSKLTSFGDWIKGFDISEQILQRGFWTSLIFFFIFPFTKLAKNKRKLFSFEKLSNNSMLATISTASGLITATLVSFIIIQWPYVFANVSTETDLKQFGVATYSEYVTRGMSELLVAASIIYIVGWIGLVVLREKKNRKTTALPIIQSLLLSSFLILLVSVFRRLWLYQAHHGLSLIRIYGGLFLVWMTGHAITLIMRHWKKKVRWVRVELVFSIIMLMFVGIFNAEKYIALNNPPTVNKRVDYVYLSRMSIDGIVGWEKSYSWAKQVLERGTGDDTHLNSDERRDLAYAGSILGNLIDRRINLYLESANLEELHQFYLDYAQHKVRLSELMIESVDEMGDKIYSGYRDDVIPGETEVVEKELKPLIKYLEENKAGEEEVRRVKLMHNRILFSNRVIFDKKGSCSTPNDSKRNSYNCLYPTSLSTIKLLDQKEDIDIAAFYSTFEKFLYINYSKLKALHAINESMPLENLLETYEEFANHYMHVISQPENGWNYEHDISLRSPLL